MKITVSFWEYTNGNQTFILDSHRPFTCSVAESTPWNLFLGSLNVYKLGPAPTKNCFTVLTPSVMIKIDHSWPLRCCICHCLNNIKILQSLYCLANIAYRQHYLGLLLYKAVKIILSCVQPASVVYSPSQLCTARLSCVQPARVSGAPYSGLLTLAA